MSLPAESFRYSRIRLALATYLRWQAENLSRREPLQRVSRPLELHSLAIAKNPLIRQRQPVWIST